MPVYQSKIFKKSKKLTTIVWKNVELARVEKVHEDLKRTNASKEQN